MMTYYCAAAAGAATPGLVLVWLLWRAFRREERRQLASRELIRAVMRDAAADSPAKEGRRRDIPLS